MLRTSAGAEGSWRRGLCGGSVVDMGDGGGGGEGEEELGLGCGCDWLLSSGLSRLAETAHTSAWGPYTARLSQVASVSLLTPSHQTADLCRPGLMSCLTLLPAFAYRVLGEGREDLNSENRMKHAFM